MKKRGSAPNLRLAKERLWRRVTLVHFVMGDAATECMKEQLEKPVCILPPSVWAYRGLVFNVTDSVRATYSLEEILLIIRYSALKEERKWRRMEAVISTTVNQKLRPTREHIPDAVKQYVWRRDQGRCVKCGSNLNLEYDHIIPVALGGSNTNRNLQLLCEPCNRSKSASI